MNRFFGMMPASEIEIEKTYKDKDGLQVTIQAGIHGWSILWADGGSTYKDEDLSAEENFKNAFEAATSVMELTEIECSESYESSEC